MPHLEKAAKLLEEPKKREDLEKLFIDYFPDKCYKIFPKSETGGEVEQNAETEFDLGWHITLDEDGRPILISHRATEFRLSLKGEDGWQNLERVLIDYCKCCYSSKMLNAEASCLTPEGFKSLSQSLKETEIQKLYILAKQFKSRAKLYAAYACRTKADFRTLHYIKMNEDFELACSIRPIVLLPDNVQLLLGDKYYDGSSIERGLRIGDEKIITCVDKERRIAYLKREIEATTERLKELQRELSELEDS